ncbi:MAG: thiamine ABC transporter substrate-binding protein [Anaerolineaceae bacterium]|nr:thiamine ABC transporter substrate-binding protein [Anaerolineaceae bacterium]
MKFLNNFLIACLLLLLALGGCAPAAQPVTTPTPVTLTVMTHDSFAISQAIVQAFEEENQVQVVFLKSGDTGAALNRAILTKESPEADVFYGVDNTFLSRAIQEGIFEPYTSPLLENIPDSFKNSLSGMVAPIDYGDVCINYDRAWFAARGLEAPQSLDDLLLPEYGGKEGEGLLAVENPATSSPGLAFLLTTIAQYGEEGYLDYWQALKANGVVVVNDWETAYYTNFSASSGKGAQPMVVSYATSPVAEVIYASSPLSEAPTASITAPATCFRQIEYAGILKGTSHLDLAQRWIDFMLSPRFQEDLPLQNFVFPVNPTAVLPEEFVKYASVAEEPAMLDPVLIANRRDQWIRDWDRVMKQ